MSLVFLFFSQSTGVSRQDLAANTSVFNNDLVSTTSAVNWKNKDFVPPLDQSKERVTKKTFGMYITPATSLVQLERFQGYHTGVDFEIFPNELTTDVAVRAVCSGTLKLKETASGYGGVAVANCTLDKKPITVIYGHLKLASIKIKEGESIIAGETIGILGANKSVETDGERKHLHLSFHLGADVNIKGYVSSPAELSNWLDPCQYVCNN
ncbi:MAG: M23 family metallopeptidase [Candidatus Falkowbacteria bacterium]|nr:M23 family metallopeptidase [Candidatus Falkowbacteria bacterium]